MKIGFLLHTMIALAGGGNGVRAQAVFQAQALERRGHDVVRLDPWASFETGTFDIVQFFLGGLGFQDIENLRARGDMRMLAFAPIIDSNVSFGGYRLAAALGDLGLRRLFTVQGELRRQARGSDLVVCRSTHERERAIRSLGVPPAKTEIVLNGVDPPSAVDPDEVRRRLDLPDEFVLHVSAFTHARKNVLRLVEAVGPLGLPLVIAGTAEPGPVLDRLHELCKHYPQVRLLGFQQGAALHGLYAACRVFCLPSLHEGTGLVALEAASHGAAIVITRNGGPPDYFGRWAEYVDPQDVQDIRAAVELAWRAARGTELRSYVLSELTWDRSVEALERAYEGHMPNPARRGNSPGGR